MSPVVAFLLDTVERAVKTFTQALLAALTVSGVTVATVNWKTALAVAGTASAVSLLTSLASFPATGTASLVATRDAPGRHAAPEDDSSHEGV
jgi:hypothetical protein